MSSVSSTDAGSTLLRASVNDAYAKHSLEGWIFSQVRVVDGMSVLDIGCGGGKQLLYLASRVSPDTRLLGIDASAGAIESVRARTAHLPNIDARQMSIDDCTNLLANERFDLIVSTYAIYYASDMPAVLSGLRKLLKEGGAIFVCGPGAGTNRELIDLVNACALDSTDRLEPIADFIDDRSVHSVSLSYARTAVSRLENPVNFPSADATIAWWRSHASYRPALEGPVRQAIEAAVEGDGHFTLSKAVLGVRFDA